MGATSAGCGAVLLAPAALAHVTPLAALSCYLKLVQCYINCLFLYLHSQQKGRFHHNGNRTEELVRLQTAWIHVWPAAWAPVWKAAPIVLALPNSAGVDALAERPQGGKGLSRPQSGQNMIIEVASKGTSIRLSIPLFLKRYDMYHKDVCTVCSF